MAAAQVRVDARPAPGAPVPAASAGFDRVSIYDAAPSAAAPKGAYEQVDYANLDDIIVWLEPMGAASATTPPAQRPQVIKLDPRKRDGAVHAVSVGQRVTFENRSRVPLSLYSVSDANEFDLNPVAPGASAEFVVRSTGLIEVLADPAKPPVARLYAAPTSHVVRTRAGRTVTFTDVPPGAYRAVAWHPRLPGSSADVTLAAGQVGNTSVTVGVAALRDARAGR